MKRRVDAGRRKSLFLPKNYVFVFGGILVSVNDGESADYFRASELQPRGLGRLDAAAEGEDVG